MKAILCVVLMMLAAVNGFARDAVGGGFTDRGIVGKWFDGEDYQGEPSFERKDVRIQFDWGTDIKPGGSNGDGLQELGVDNYSVIWTGHIISRYSEEYTFYFTTDNDVEMKIGDDGYWTELFDISNSPGVHTETFMMTAKKKYDIEIKYRETTGEAKAILEWSSSSFPKEVIDPVIQLSLNNTYQELLFTDAMQCGRSSWQNVEIDEDGWPKGDGSFIFSEILQPFNAEPLETGLMQLSFKGEADVGTFGNCKVVDNSTLYDEDTGITVMTLEGIDRQSNVASISIENAERVNGTPGVTDVKIMRPTAVNSESWFDLDTIFHPLALKAYSKFTGIRFQRVNDQAINWEQRTPADFPYQKSGTRLPFVYNDRYGGGNWNLVGRSGMSHEYEIMFCNTLGNDYYISTPHLASMEYISNLAKLVKYGSDKDGIPYEQVTKNPVHPPLNPNLRVYLELSNELWNFAQVATYAAYYDLQEEVQDMYDNKDSRFDLLNYDGLAEKDGVNDNGVLNAKFALSRRWWTYKTALYGEEFRKVFGDECMPQTSICPRVRPYFGWQYNNANGTCTSGLSFMEDVLNNSNYVVVAHSPNYYIYAGGGAGYYSAENKFGNIEGVSFGGGFEDVIVETFTNSPTSGTFSFDGDAGICRDGLNMPTVQFGDQAAYLDGKGSKMSFEFTAPEDQLSTYYAVNYRAVLPENTTIDGDYLHILVNGEDVTYTKGRGTQPLAWTSSALWNRVAWWIGSWYFTDEFQLLPGETGSISFESQTDQCPVFIDEITMSSLDAFYKSEIPSGGSAMGQSVVGNVSHGSTIMGDGRWATTFGLEYMTYEHGWSAGGDAGDTPIQLRAKFYDERAADSVVTAMDIFFRAGGFNPTFGTYSIWPGFSENLRIEGGLDVDAWPLMQGLNQFADNLPPIIDNGKVIPGALFGQKWNAVLDIWHTEYDNLQAGQWISYDFVAGRPGKYKVLAVLDGGGEAQVSINGCSPVVASGSASGVLQALVDLQFGLNSIRVTGLVNTTAVERIICVPADMSDEDALSIRAKYKTEDPETKETMKQKLIFASDDFSVEPQPLSTYGGGSGWLEEWYVQNNDEVLPGYEIRTTNTLAADSGGYAVGGRSYLSCGRTIKFDNIPSALCTIVDTGKTGFGAPGSTIFTTFLIRAEVIPSKLYVGWSTSSSPTDRNNYTVSLVAKDDEWHLALKDSNNNWVYSEKGIGIEVAKTYKMQISVSFSEYGADAKLFVDGIELADMETDAEIGMHTFVFYPGSTINGLSIDNLEVSNYGIGGKLLLLLSSN
jgi:hypothetical protein